MWDESILKNSRTCVSWVSPNTWAPGSIYGNICFEFPWRKLVDRKNLFWVEAIQYYSPPAYRILVTDKEEPLAKLRAYDATRRRGPVYHDLATDAWYRNGEFTGELLVDGDLSLKDCTQVTFVDHHDKICKREGCVDLGRNRNDAGAQLVAMLIGSGVRNASDLFLCRGARPKALHMSAEGALVHLLRKISRCPNKAGPIDANSPVARYLATALFARAGTGGERGLAALAGLFVNGTALRATLLSRVERHFGLSTVDQLEELL